MRIAVQQPYFFPYLEYFQLINAVQKFVVYDDVNFIKRGWINRNRILMNGEIHRFTLHLHGASQNRLINEITVGENKEKILKTIFCAYKKAPYFSENFPLVESVLLSREKNLCLFLSEMLMQLASYFGINATFNYSSEIPKDKTLKGQQKVLEICKLENAKEYINLPGGSKLYDQNMFGQVNISIKFLQKATTTYPQFKKQFIPGLSIIDVLMFNSGTRVKEFLDQYKLSEL